MTDQPKPRVEDIDDDVEIHVTLNLTLPSHLFKRTMLGEYRETADSIEEASIADGIRWLCRESFADFDSETFQKHEPGYVEGIDRPRFADYNDKASYERAKTRWRTTIRALGFDPNDMPLFPADEL